MILDRYFARRFALTFAALFAMFLAMLGFVDLIEEARRHGGEAAGFAPLVSLALLSLPSGIYGLMPIITILATIGLFLSLARSSEMVVTRASGRAALRALVAPVAVILAIGTLALAVLNPLAAATSRAYEARAAQLSGEAPVTALSGDGLWLRQGDGDRQSVIHARAASLDGTLLSDVSILTYAGPGAPVERLQAATAELVPGAWDLTGVKRWDLTRSANPEAEAQTLPRYELPSSLTAERIRDSFGTPSSIAIWELPGFITALREAGFSAHRHEVYFQMELAGPLFLVAMVLIGAAFTMRHQRGGRTGLMVLAAILLGFGSYFVRNFAQILGESGQIAPILAAWAPPLAAAALALGLILHLEDG